MNSPEPLLDISQTSPASLARLLQEKTLLLGTGNRKKVLELEVHLQPRGFHLRTPTDFPEPLEVEETGSNFMENARLKAIAQGVARSMWAIGEDSGLCVPALGGAPGVFSARYSGPDATDAANNAKLLAEMQAIGAEDRDAYYVSTIALSDPDGNIVIETMGECWGRILAEPRGSSGFGYDPLFEVREYHRTFAEMGLQVKRAISHRSRAVRAFLRQLDILNRMEPKKLSYSE
jgi:XTP/dITP diphosphohydrolase